jgi:hypothetical protein
MPATFLLKLPRLGLQTGYGDGFRIQAREAGDRNGFERRLMRLGEKLFCRPLRGLDVGPLVTRPEGRV